MAQPTVKIQGADQSVDDSAGDPLIISANAARLYTITAYNGSGSNLYLHLFDRATVPSTGVTVPKLCLKIPTDTTGAFDFSDGHIFKTGIVFAWSTVALLYTTTASAEGTTLTSITFRKTAP